MNSNLDLVNAEDHIKRAYELLNKNGSIFNEIIIKTIVNNNNNKVPLVIPISNKSSIIFSSKDDIYYLTVEIRRKIFKNIKYDIVLNSYDINEIKSFFK
jgi:hypothetical protein